MHAPHQYTGPAKDLATKVVELEGRIEELEDGSSGPVDLSELNLEALESRWELETDPAEYLERYPDAGNSELARAIVAARSE